MKINGELIVGNTELQLNQISTNRKEILKIHQPQFASSNTNQISITPTYDCYVIVYGQAATWGFDGGVGNVYVSCSSGGATSVAQMVGRTTGHNTVGDSTGSFSVFACKAGINYTFKCNAGSGGANYVEMFLFTMIR